MVRTCTSFLLLKINASSHSHPKITSRATSQFNPDPSKSHLPLSQFKQNFLFLLLCPLGGGGDSLKPSVTPLREKAVWLVQSPRRLPWHKEVAQAGLYSTGPGWTKPQPAGHHGFTGFIDIMPFSSGAPHRLCEKDLPGVWIPVTGSNDCPFHLARRKMILKTWRVLPPPSRE